MSGRYRVVEAKTPEGQRWVGSKVNEFDHQWADSLADAEVFDARDPKGESKMHAAMAWADRAGADPGTVYGAPIYGVKDPTQGIDVAF